MNFNDFPINEILGLAVVVQRAERWNDMRQIVRNMVTRKIAHKQQLNLTERMLLTSAYKNVTASKRRSLRIITEETCDTVPTACLNKYKEMVEAELEEVCKEEIHLLYMMKGYEEKTNQDGEIMVFLLKTLADSHRYLAESKPNSIFSQNADKYYEEAFDLAKRKLPPAHPLRLELALNYSVCCHEIIKNEDQACRITKDAIDSAVIELDPLKDHYYNDSVCILQLLRDNLSHWTSSDDKRRVSENYVSSA